MGLRGSREGEGEMKNGGNGSGTQYSVTGGRA